MPAFARAHATLLAWYDTTDLPVRAKLVRIPDKSQDNGQPCALPLGTGLGSICYP